MTEQTPPLSAPNAELQPSFLDYLKLTLIPFHLSWAFLQVVARRTKKVRHNDLPFLKDFVLTIARSGCLPISILRSTSDASSSVLKSPRFRPKHENLYASIVQKDVSGYWMCKGAPGSPIDPANCDIVLYYIHGGAYTEGHPARSLPVVLRIAELAAERNLTFSCFALRYSFAPEKRWPTQLNQAISGYRYLLEDQGIDARKIAVLGESAGAHLALCLLSSLQEAQLPKPERGVFLQSPWVDLSCTERESWRRNKYKDFLAISSLRQFGRQLFPESESYESSPFLDFSKPLPKDVGTWKDILPERVWISAGGDEVFLDEIVAFKDVLESDGVKPECEIEEGGMHVWQGMNDVFDVGKYLKCDGDVPKGLLRGARNIADAVLKGANTSSSNIDG